MTPTLIFEIIPTETVAEGAKNKMTEHALKISFNSDVTVADILEQRELDVTSLNQDDASVPVQAPTNEMKEIDERSLELAMIEEFIKKNGVTRPTEEDFQPKSQRWSRNVKTKAQKLAENPNYMERRGRKRTTFTKDVTFICLDNGTYKRAGRGRAKLGETRESFTLYHTNVEKASEGSWTREQLEAMKKSC